MKHLPLYVTRKTVRAAQIAAIEELSTSDGHLLYFTDPTLAPVSVEKGWVAKRSAQIGGYFIVYADGYTSWSPAQAFEESATLKETPTIELRPVQSSMLKAHGYDEATRTLAVQFTNGDVYHYEDVSSEAAQALANAESAGGYFGKYIRGKYTSTKQ